MPEAVQARLLGTKDPVELETLLHLGDGTSRVTTAVDR